MHSLHIETPRLLITEFDLGMAHDVHVNSLDEDNRRFVPDEVFETEEAAIEVLMWLIDSYSSKTGPFVYPVLLKTGQNIGYVQANPYQGGFELGYHIAKPYTGHGYATEAARAFLPMITYWLGIDSIAGICLQDNLASRAVLEKCGFALVYSGLSKYKGNMREVFEFVWEAKRT